jgi:hypothetical protein
MELDALPEMEGDGQAAVGYFIGFGKAGFGCGRSGGELNELVIDRASRIKLVPVVLMEGEKFSGEPSEQ